MIGGAGELHRAMISLSAAEEILEEARRDHRRARWRLEGAEEDHRLAEERAVFAWRMWLETCEEHSLNVVKHGAEGQTEARQ